MTILTQVRENGSMFSNFFNSWALAAGTLIWANLIGLLVQVDIPAEVWSQYPLILIGVVLVGWLARYWVLNERDWREFVVKQVSAAESSNLRTLQLIQSNNENLHRILLEQQAEQLRLQREGLKETFDAELERVLDLLAKANHYDQQKMGRPKNDQA